MRTSTREPPVCGATVAARAEAGFTITELLVVIVVIGVLAAVALPSFLAQKSKGSDAEAKSVAVTASRAIEACASERGGRYAECSKEALLEAEPSLRDVGPRLDVIAGVNDYRIVVTSSRDPSVSFTLLRSSDGTTSRTCSIGAVDRGGCRAPSTGIW